MKTHDQLVKALMNRPCVEAEVDRIECEDAVLLDTLHKARHEAGLTPADIAQRMGTLEPAIARPAEANTSDACRSSFVVEAAHQSAMVARSSFAAEDQSFVDAVSEIDPSK